MIKNDTGNQAILNTMIQGLKDRGIRLTPQRMTVLKLLVGCGGHPTAEQIYQLARQEFPTMSLATVYQNLAALKEAGYVVELGFGSGSSRYDFVDAEFHAHLVCTRCGEIQDTRTVDLESMADHIIKDSGYRLVGQRLDFYGICPRCQNEVQSQQ